MLNFKLYATLKRHDSFSRVLGMEKLREVGEAENYFKNEAFEHIFY